ncbi:MAG TPA: hypothetical protein VN950_26850 [Terriglobales bacterium]|nr:hypothetical protein [Terriglobales bacterium]
MTWQEKAIRQIRETLEPAQANALVDYIKAASSLRGSESVFRRVAQAARAKDVGAILDYFAEIRFGLTFAELQFDTAFEPLGEKGPDLSVSRNCQSACIEVKRLRPRAKGDQLVSRSGDENELVQYGNPEMAVKKIEDELLAKFRQVKVGIGIVAFWSDSITFEDIEFELAIRHIQGDAEKGIHRVPDGLLFSIYASGWTSTAGQQLYCAALKQVLEPFSIWMEELKKAGVS